jgi:hypothetical protein
LALTGLAALILTGLAFWPLGSPLPLVERLLSEARTGPGFSPAALLILQAQNLGYTVSTESLLRTTSILFGLLILWLLWRTWTGRSPLRGAADTFFGYVYQALRYRIWYAAWPLAWLILDSGRSDESDLAARARLAAGQTMLFASQVSVLIYGQIRSELFGRSHRYAHSVAIPAVFILPLVLATMVWVISKRQGKAQAENLEEYRSG